MVAFKFYVCKNRFLPGYYGSIPCITPIFYIFMRHTELSRNLDLTIRFILY